MRRFIFSVLGILAACFVIYILVLLLYTYSDGERAGTLYKFSHKGYVFKTYEGEMIIGGSNPMLINEQNKWIFSVAEDSVAKKLISAEGRYVRLHYKEKLRTLPWRGDSRYIVDKIIEVK